MSVPTIARTMFLRNLLAVMVKHHLPWPWQLHSACMTWHNVVFMSLFDLQKAAKSSTCSSHLAAVFMASKSSG